ncbi:diacylglycerol kinase family protein [Micromonospora sp. D75]|uniref:diacylglycerol/lipid kinase family protein n=1 Tax=Micromonospora sp. D75 TaxID=2824885 RepID=UPI001B39B65D|nr:diacylglycerol kinase family protein [Micromonospora sp. D75]MBQ1070999.1 diacylglycerol kinase [Micromonospora sp. D75]
MDGADDKRPVNAENRTPRSAVVVNPVKVADLDEFRRTVEGALAAAGWPAPTWYETTVEDPGRGQTEQAVKAGAEVVFACGGDGTVMACVTALAGTDVALAVLPQGTGNLLAANLGLSNDLRRRARSVLVANVGRLQGGVRLLTDAEPDDGWLDVAVLTPRALRHWLAMGWAVLRRRDSVPRMEVFRARSVEITSTRAQPRQLDGDLIEPGRSLKATIRPESLWLCVPRPEEHPDLAVDADAVGERGEHLVEEARRE